MGADPVEARRAQMLAEDEADLGYVMNTTRLWSRDPTTHDQLFALIGQVGDSVGLAPKHRLLVVTATSAARSSGYCVLAWVGKYPRAYPPEVLAAVVSGDDELAGLDVREAALVRWARRVATLTGPVPEAEVEALRAAGWSDEEVFAVTVFAALRIAFSTVNDALGALPDEQLRARVPAEVLAAYDARLAPDSPPG